MSSTAREGEPGMADGSMRTAAPSASADDTPTMPIPARHAVTTFDAASRLYQL